MSGTKVDQWLENHAEDYLNYAVTDVDQALCDALRDAQERMDSAIAERDRLMTAALSSRRLTATAIGGVVGVTAPTVLRRSHDSDGFLLGGRIQSVVSKMWAQEQARKELDAYGG